MTQSLSRRRVLGLAALPLATLLSPMAQGKDRRMRVFITGSTDGLGRDAARTLIDEGHQVVLHARSKQRASALADLAPRAAGVAIGDLASAAETRALADQVNKIGRMDAVIHNAGIYREPNRGPTPEGHAKVLAVNVLAPYMLTQLIERPDRLIYLSSSMHHGGEASLRDIDWTERRWDTNQAYSDSKLFITALAIALAKRWPKTAEQRGRSGLGADQDGRRRRARRSRRRAPHADLARGQRRSRRESQWCVLASPQATKARGRCARHGLSGQADREAG